MTPDRTNWTSAIDATGTQTFCGRCGHPMHWHECGTGANLTSGPCRCRNDIDTYSPLDPDPLTVFRPEPERRSCSVISWLLLSWAIAAVAGIALLVWWAWA